MAVLAEIGSNVLLFCLVFGMSATVDIGHLRKQLRNRAALLTGISLQFVILPFMGFVIVKLLDMSAPLGVSLLVITSSPGGSYSNWWCSMFNADLALSVTMTAISTLLSVVMLPVNLVIYTTNTYSSAVVKSLDWSALFVSLIVVIGGISIGLFCSAYYSSHRFNLLANKLGNLAGISLIIFSATVSSSSEDSSLWGHDAKFYIGVATPAVVGVTIATYMASRFKLDKPERVAVAVEACYQNTGIATSIAVAMFTGDDRATAIGVPLFYGICEAVVLAIYCMLCWKLGWTKAPANENFCTIISTSYEVENSKRESPNAIEVVYGAGQQQDGGNEEQPIDDLIFTQSLGGYEFDQDALHERPNADPRFAVNKGSMSPPSQGVAVDNRHDAVNGTRDHGTTSPQQGIESEEDDDYEKIPATGKTID